MAGIAQLTNLSQQQYNQGMNPEQGMRQTNVPVFQADTSKVNDLAKDLTSIIKGIENYKQVKHDLSVDATEEMARDHLITVKETINEAMSNQDLSFDERRKIITEATTKSIDLSSEYLKDDVELQKIYDKVYTDNMRQTLSSTMAKIDLQEDEHMLNVKFNSGKDYLSKAPEEANMDGLKKIFSTHLKRGLTTEEQLKSLLIKTKIDAAKNSYGENMYSVNDKYMKRVFGELADDDEVKSFYSKIKKDRSNEIERIKLKQEKRFSDSLYDSYIDNPSIDNVKSIIKVIKDSKYSGGFRNRLLSYFKVQLGDLTPKGTTPTEFKKSLDSFFEINSIKNTKGVDRKLQQIQNVPNTIAAINKHIENIDSYNLKDHDKKKYLFRLNNMKAELTELIDVKKNLDGKNSVYAPSNSESSNYVQAVIDKKEQVLMNAVNTNNPKVILDAAADLFRTAQKTPQVKPAEIENIDSEFMNASYVFTDKQKAINFTTIAKAVSDSGVKTLYKSIGDVQLINELNKLNPQDENYLDRFNQVRTSWQIGKSKVVVKGDDKDIDATNVIDDLRDNTFWKLDMDIPSTYAKKLIVDEMKKRNPDNPVTSEEAEKVLTDNLIPYDRDYIPTENQNKFVANTFELASSITGALFDTRPVLPLGLGGSTSSEVIQDAFSGFLAEKNLNVDDVKVTIYNETKGNNLPAIWIEKKSSGKIIGTINSDNFNKYHGLGTKIIGR